MALLEPFTQGVHVAPRCRLTDPQHLAVIKQLARRPVPEQLKEKSSPPALAVRRIRILLSPETVLQFVEIFLLPAQRHALSLVIHKLQVIFSDAELEIVKFALNCTLAYAKVIRDLLFAHRRSVSQQNFKNLLRSGCKFHLIPPN